ncbi:hypothetical protein E4U17_006301 [Claviceps sp. LM77 group G4]|nr:hypothetical protein E4U17_006301 [Claviceps sp. LM77 group G4]KAG6062967.1 hypothetical protein E4U33_006412 [Claviceps sp. LM78 group G4]KAG6079794.1 hypothetical protein E4U16_000812 [Claviceps sp. LM84 group G4]
MSGILSYIIGGGGRVQAIPVPPVEVHHVETDPDRRARSLKHLLKANHVNYALVSSQLRYDNQNAQILSSAYLLGATPNQLHDIYETQVSESKLEAWTPSPAELMDSDWVDFLGDKQYQRAYLDYFEDKLAMDYAYDWKKAVGHYLFSCEKPLVHGLISGLGHALIQLGLAYEMDSKEIAMEALALTSVQHDFLYDYSSDSSFTKKSSISSDSILDLLDLMSKDEELNSLPSSGDFGNLESIFKENEGVVMKYWNAWDLSDPLTAFKESQQAAVALLVTAVDPAHKDYNFFLLHVLTTSHAIRTLLSFFPMRYHVNLVRQWWLLVIALYIVRGRPRLVSANVGENPDGRDWKWVQHTALTSPFSKDAYFLQGLRAMRDLACTWGDDDKYYLRAATTFLDNFRGWHH